MNYHDHPAISASKLKKIITGTPLDYWAAYEDPQRTPVLPTEAMQQGSLVDALLTQPKRFDDLYEVAPNVDRRTKAGKEQWKESQLKARARGAQVVSAPWVFNAKSIANTLKTSPQVEDYLDGDGQHPHYWHDSEFDIDCRYLPDIENPETGLLCDLKKTKCASPRQFQAQAYSLGYDIQLAHYAEGFKDKHGSYPKTLAFIAYEWNWPFNHSVLVASESFIEMGRRRREEAICLIKECRGLNEWPSHGVGTIDPPRWDRSTDLANSTNADDLDLEGLE